MCENVKQPCSCDEGYDKGVLKKTIENNIFTIFGNLSWDNSIVIRYHGILQEKDNSLPIRCFYTFDIKTNPQKEMALTKCTKSIGECYCLTIDLEKHSKIFFGFKDANNSVEQNGNEMFELNILKDPISDIMQRYGFEQNKNLPVCNKNRDKCFSFLKAFFKKIFEKCTKRDKN